MDQKSHIKEQARVRQARRRARLKTEGVTVTVTLTHEEASMLEELKQVRRMGREPYSPNEFFQLLLIRNWQSWQADKVQLGVCKKCGKEKMHGGCGGEFQEQSLDCWLRVGANQLNL